MDAYLPPPPPGWPAWSFVAASLLALLLGSFFAARLARAEPATPVPAVVYVQVNAPSNPDGQPPPPQPLAVPRSGGAVRNPFAEAEKAVKFFDAFAGGGGVY